MTLLRTAFFQLQYLNSAPITNFSDIQEICDTQTFERSCPSGEVLLVHSAKYGRMALGKCVTKDFGQLGCYKDVTGVLNRRCAGKQSCSVLIWKADTDLMESYPCEEDLTPYLEIDTSCQSGKPTFGIQGE